MGQNSGIQWTDDTRNFWQGCHKVSPGCKNCYMYRDKKRFGQDPTTVIRSAPATFNGKKDKGPLVFVCSWSDFFIEEADPWRDEAWGLIRSRPDLTFQILTKRPQNIRDRLPDDWGSGWLNVWLGVSVEDTQNLWRIVYLEDMENPPPVRFVSYEPALEYVDFTAFSPTIDWLISGGESGPNFRPARLDWFRQVRDDCLKNEIPFFHKQHGGKVKVNGAWGGRILDGEVWQQMPEGLKND